MGLQLACESERKRRLYQGDPVVGGNLRAQLLATVDEISGAVGLPAIQQALASEEQLLGHLRSGASL